ncbi:MAG: hypothetical protein M3M88_06260, partial [Thermoproteota archaeon]|nr:hypothetical protein [Thermoproteota archaeon]
YRALRPIAPPCLISSITWIKVRVEFSKAAKFMAYSAAFLEALELSKASKILLKSILKKL